MLFRSVDGDSILYGYPEVPQQWGDERGVLELCSLQGTIEPGEDGKLEPRLNGTFGNAAGTVMGGRIAEGTLVMMTCELSIAEIDYGD